MKNILLFAISVYQAVVSPLLKQVIGVRFVCRFTPSCSAYAQKVIGEYGVIKGGILTTRRFFSCQPFFNTKA